MKDNPLFAILLALLTLVLILFVGFQAWNAWAAHDYIGVAPKSPDTFTIQGEGKVTGQPTLAQVDLGLYSEGLEVAAVQADNSRKVNAIIDAMKTLGISDADLQTSNYSISPKFDYRNGVQNVIGYTVSQSVNVKVRDLTKVGAVIAKAGELGANQVNGVTFTIDDPTELKQQARKKAIDDAKKKAQELADAMGVRIIRVTTFSESANQPGPIPYAFNGLEAVKAAPSAPPEIQAGSLDVISDVSVTFEIR